MDKIISSSLREARFILVKKNTKIPKADFKGDNWKEKEVDYETANKSLIKYNPALFCGKNGFFGIDCDRLELAQACEGLLPKTYSEQTCTPGHFHYIYRIKGTMENLNITSEDKIHYGELRCNDCIILLSPSRARDKQGKLGDYKILSEVDNIPYITKEQVKEVLLKFMNPTKTEPKGKISQELLEKINKDSELKTLFETELDKGVRSEAEQQLVDKLVSRDFDKEEIYNIMGSSKIGKWNEKPISYREMTYNKAVQFVTTQKAQATQPTQEERLKVMTLRDYEKYKPDKNYIIKDIKKPGESEMLYAPSGSFKSLLVLYQACCIVTGKPYLNKFKSKRQPVLILSAENKIEEDKKRLRLILKGLKSEKKDIPLYILPRGECQNVLDLGFNVLLRRFIEEKKIKVIYLDTINPLTPELDDNKGKDVTKFFNEFIKPICDDYKINNTFLHHTQKTEGTFLGSVKWKANVDSAWRIERKGLDNKVKIYNEKSRGGEFNTMELELVFSDEEIKFNLLSMDKAEIYSRRKKMTQEEFFILKLNQLIKVKETERAVIQATFTEHKITYSTATLDRAISKWRDIK